LGSDGILVLKGGGFGERGGIRGSGAEIPKMDANGDFGYLKGSILLVVEIN
jgi:hypothetical protein